MIWILNIENYLTGKFHYSDGLKTHRYEKAAFVFKSALLPEIQ